MTTYEKPYVIAEIGCNHKGEMEIAKDLETKPNVKRYYDDKKKYKQKADDLEKIMTQKQAMIEKLEKQLQVLDKELNTVHEVIKDLRGE